MTAPTQGEVKRSEVEAEGTTLHQGVIMREPSGRAVLEEFPARGIDITKPGGEHSEGRAGRAVTIGTRSPNGGLNADIAE